MRLTPQIYRLFVSRITVIKTKNPRNLRPFMMLGTDLQHQKEGNGLGSKNGKVRRRRVWKRGEGGKEVLKN